LVTTLVGAERRRAEAEEAADAAAAALRAAEREHHSWAARGEALALALDEARARAGAERLAEVRGVVGTLVELVAVDPGWEAAFEAAAGEAVAAVVVDGVESARAALSRLREEGATGAVLPADAARVPASLGLSAASVEGAEPVRAHVRSARPGVERLLDGLLASAVAVDGGWTAALDLALEHPGLTAVTREGDRFTSTGWRTGAAGPRVTGAALDEARRRAEESEENAARLDAAVRTAQEQLGAARAVEADLSRSLDSNDTRMSAAADAVRRLEGERRDVSVEREGVRVHVDELEERLRRDEERVAELEAALPSLEAQEAAGLARRQERRVARARLEERAAGVGARRRDLEVRRAGLDERRALLARRLEEIEDRLRDKAEQRLQAAARRQQLEGVAVATERLAALVTDRAATLEAAWAEVRERRRQQQEAVRARAEQLDGLRRERSAAERRLSELRERAQRLELEEAEARLRLESAVESLRRDLDREPEAAREAPCPELPPGTSPANRVRELERELRVMGPVNPLALEEFDALQERHRFLEEQLDDVKAGRRDLAKVIRAIDTEIVDVFAAAFADVSDNFSKLFATLFPGGAGRLRLTDPDDLLNTGIEVEARPSGKNVRKLSLLSGGERSLTALAFLFAVFRSRPSPFYLLDEVEAALDDVNLHRFLDLIHEFRAEAQLVIVSHQKRTMEAADCLYGVTMQPGASSKVISERVRAGT
jgi:chromosome segregation protein